MFNNVQKLATDIIGLDELFYGGIQLLPFEKEQIKERDSRDSDSISQRPSIAKANSGSDGIIIVLTGARGINKMQFAMQMLQGLTNSIYSLDKETRNESIAPIFYSLNKTKDNLQDVYLDLLISKQIRKIIKNNLSTSSDSWKGQQFGRCIFDLDNQIMPFGRGNDVKDFIDKYISERTVTYNSRTNSLHYVRSNSNLGDSNNLLFHRWSNDVNYYCANGKDRLKYLPDDDLGKSIRNDFFPVLFNPHEAEGVGHFDYAKRQMHKYQDVIINLEERHRENQNKINFVPCIVIDGFSMLSDLDLSTISISHLEKTLRETSKVSVLILDERAKNLSHNADIVIEMRKSEDLANSYTYHELQITKSVFQEAVLGWHQYKRREYGIEVFPSIHRLLQRRNYMSYLFANAHQGVLKESFEDFLHTPNKPEGDHELYDVYERGKEEREIEVLKRMARNIEISKQKQNFPQCYHEYKLQSLLIGRLGELSCKCKTTKQGGNDGENKFVKYIQDSFLNNCYRKEITTFIGNPNTFKRFIANAAIFNAAKCGEHTLIILFDQEEYDMRSRIVCPDLKTAACIGNKYSMCSSCHEEKDSCGVLRCHKCYDKIHFLGVRMGCIPTDELFHIIKQQLEMPFSDGKKISHIVVDDLQKIDYSFPLLHKDSLFLSALISLCRENNVSMQILCDKRETLTGTLCSLSDNVICVKREEHEPDSVTLYIEKDANAVQPSEIYKYKISNVLRLFKCTGNHMVINCNDIKEMDSMQNGLRGTTEGDVCNDVGAEQATVDVNQARVQFKQIGSVKGFWRNKIDVVYENKKT